MNKNLTRLTRIYFALCAFSVCALQVNPANAHIDLVPVDGLSAKSLHSTLTMSNSDEEKEIHALTIFDAGNECTSATIISSLPHNTSGNTLDFANDYSNSDVPAEAAVAITNSNRSNFYLSGPEAFYAYPPASNQNVTVGLTGTADWTADWTALWAFTGCPFSTVVGYLTSPDRTTHARFMYCGLPRAKPNMRSCSASIPFC